MAASDVRRQERQERGERGEHCGVTLLLPCNCPFNQIPIIDVESILAEK